MIRWLASCWISYRDDPDAGIHGAAEWTLRKWGQQAKLKETDNELMKVKERGDKRWFVNGQGQTFAVIDGPVAFQMGSPPTDTERAPGNEPQTCMRIPRRFAIASKEVSIEQFQRFLKLAGITNERYNLGASFLTKFSPDPDGPWIGPDWYTAAHYCNWLSEREGLRKDQWCYLDNEGANAEGMSIPANVLERLGLSPAHRGGMGVRLPVRRDHQQILRSLDRPARRYARYQGNSKEHAWACGSLFPNDLGLFDMLGNQYEWCQDSFNASRTGKNGLFSDDINVSSFVNEKNPRLLRGGAFNNRPAGAARRTVTGMRRRTATRTSGSASPGLTTDLL